MRLAQAPTKLGLKPGATFGQGRHPRLVTRSANDVAVVIAENLGGSEVAFAEHDDAQGSLARHVAHDVPQRIRPAQSQPGGRRRATWRCSAWRCARTFRTYYRYFSTTQLRLQGPRRSATTTSCSAASRASTASRPATPALPASISFPRCKRDNRYIVATVMGGSSGASRDPQMIGLIDTYLAKATRGPDKICRGEKGKRAESQLPQWRLPSNCPGAVPRRHSAPPPPTTRRCVSWRPTLCRRLFRNSRLAARWRRAPTSTLPPSSANCSNSAVASYPCRPHRPPSKPMPSRLQPSHRRVPGFRA